MNTIVNHILETTGEPVQDEPNANRGDVLIGVFVLGLILGWITSVPFIDIFGG